MKISLILECAMGSKEKVNSRLVIDNHQDLKRAKWIAKKINNNNTNADYIQLIDLALSGK